MGLTLIVLILGVFLLLVSTAAVALFMALVLRRPGRPADDPDDAPSPLEQAQAAAAALTPTEWDEFRRWVEGRRTLPPSQGEGIRR